MQAKTGYLLLYLFVVCLTVISAAYYSNELQNTVVPNYLKRICKDVVLAQFVLLCLHLPGWMENHKNLGQDSQCPS
jgi:hypothetical protein